MPLRHSPLPPLSFDSNVRKLDLKLQPSGRTICRRGRVTVRVTRELEIGARIAVLEMLGKHMACLLLGAVTVFHLRTQGNLLSNQHETW